MDNFQFAFSFTHHHAHLRMKTPRPCTQVACKSAIFSIADYIIENFPFLKPPYKYEGEWQKPKVSEEAPWEGNIFHPYYEIWQEVLMDRVTQGHALRFQNTLFVDIELPSAELGAFKIPESFEQVDIQTSSLSPAAQVEKVFELPAIPKVDKKYLILATHHFERQGFPFSMRICKDAILLGALFYNETWRIVYFGRGPIPAPEELAHYDAVMLPGSMSSVLDWTPELQTYFQNLRTAMDLNAQLRVIGICFGYQALAQFFGGKVERTGRKGGIEKIDFDQTLFEEYGYLQELPKDEPWLVSEYHEDEVTQLPEGFRLLGRSESCEREGMIGLEGRVVGLQFHSQYYPKYTKVYQQRYNYYCKEEALTKFYLPSSPQMEERSMAHSAKFYKFFQSFMRGDS